MADSNNTLAIAAPATDEQEALREKVRREYEELKVAMPWADDNQIRACLKAKYNPKPKRTGGGSVDPNSTSQKILAMYKASGGQMTGYGIAKELGIIPQFANNVLAKARKAGKLPPL